MRGASACVGVTVLAAVAGFASPGFGEAQPAHFDLQAEGVGFAPVGSLSDGAEVRARDHFAAGPGFAFTASLGVHERVHVAVRAGRLKSRKDADFAGFEDRGWPPPDGGAAAPNRVRRILSTVPVQAVLQVRWPLNRSVGLFGEAGGGISTFSEKITLYSGATPLLTIAGHQQAASMELGAGVSAGLSRTLDVTARIAYQQAFAGDGAVWASGDGPKFVTGAVGVRYPRRPRRRAGSRRPAARGRRSPPRSSRRGPRPS